MAKSVRVSIGLKKTTKDKLDNNKAPGQCYEGFVCQLIDLWETTKKENPSYIWNPRKRR
jgi:hypothetical protein